MGAREIAVAAVDTLRSNIRTAMADAGKNATGDTSRRIDVLPSGGEGAGFGQAALEMDANWKYVGNGRGPGGAPPIARLERWTAVRGLDVSPYALQASIAKKGTRDFRLKRPNIPLQEAKAWEVKEVPKAEEQLAKGLEDRVTSLIDQTIKRNG